MRLLTTTVTSLEIRRHPTGPIEVGRIGDGYEIAEVLHIPLDDYRRLYHAVGSDHHWTSRLLPDDRLAEEIHDSATRIFLLTHGDQVAGWFELDIQHAAQEARIVHLGILEAFRGRGLSGFLVDYAVGAAFAAGIDRLTIETNTLDHPAALPLYQKHGFRAYARRTVQTPAIDEVEALQAGRRG